MKNYVIIGNSIAATGCIEGIRSVDKRGKITVVSKENAPAYCRPLISYYLESKTTLEKMSYRAESFYSDNNCKVLYGKEAVSIDENKKTIHLDDGQELSYSSICVATGSSPFVPPFNGLDLVENKFEFMTISDMLALEKAVSASSNVLIVGAGLIGLKCAEGLLKRVKSITVCDLAGRVLSSILDDECAAIMQKHLEKNGITFCLSDSVSRFEKNVAHMQSGKTIPFDVVVLAVGVRANTSLIKNAGGKVERGIIVNSKMRTSLKNIYAAGDCVETEDISFGSHRVLAILPNAYMQGRIAGLNMAGEPATFDKGIPMNSIGFFGLHAMTAGTYTGQMYEEKGDNYIKRLFTKKNHLCGYILIGKTDRAGIYTSLIREQTPLDEINFDLLKTDATSAAFSPELRRKMFGGVV